MTDHIREHNSVLAAAEKRLLVAIAHRLPRAVTSDHLTLLAFGAMVLAGVGYARAHHNAIWLWIVIGALALNWFGDSLDGTVARVRHLERPRYGFYVDHVVDIVGITLLMAGLACSGFMMPAIALRDDPHVLVPWLGRVQMFDVGGVVAAIGLMVALAVSVYRNASDLARL